MINRQASKSKYAIEEVSPTEKFMAFASFYLDSLGNFN
jgi:hypothetical protein